ncbi:hypothetical protein PFLUV_G00090980 [Perca fluviatilis]|uniref:Uncharacterized protein n=1 Tax=Perca fluviatilis TaxID=8168 RepID=A0A6A5EGQ3_PERFL|nr:hypothetical protein PFLUV_G00090980 [Perca fluviatilis]
MFSFKELLSAVALTLLAVTVEASTNRAVAPTEQDRDYGMPLSQLIRLYHTPVYKAERMKRLGISRLVLGPISQYGVRVTLADGSQWLVHRGDHYEYTVVTHPDDMSSNWMVVQTVNFHGTKKVWDFVDDHFLGYIRIFKKCHLDSCRMMNL